MTSKTAGSRAKTPQIVVSTYYYKGAEKGDKASDAKKEG